MRHLQEFLSSAIAKRPVLLDRVRHGDALIAKWWRDEGEQEFVAAIHEKNHDRITSWLNNLPTTSVTAATSSETRMLETLGAIATDETPSELNAELLQAVAEANKERRKVHCLRRAQIRFPSHWHCSQSAIGRGPNPLHCAELTCSWQANKASRARSCSRKS